MGQNSTRQLALDLGHNPSFTREDFLPGVSNHEALRAIENWQEWQGKAAIIAGPVGAGKSHLATIWAESAGAPLMPLPQVNDEVLESLQDGFCLCVEDVDGVVELGKETALFHLINLLKQRGGRLLLTARTRPQGWNVGLADLLSRLRAIPVYELHEPDEALLQTLLLKLFADRQLEVGPDITSYLAVRMERSGAFAHRLVDAIDKEALAAHARITKPMAARILNQLMQPGWDL